MFDVTIINLKPDFSAAIPDLGAYHVGSIDEARLQALLDQFRRINPVENHDADPQVVVRTVAGKFLVRTRQQKLFLYDARNSNTPYIELDAAGVVTELNARPAAVSAPLEEEAPVREKTPHRAIAFSILIAGILLNAYTVYAVFQAESINEKPSIVFVTDAKELTALHQSAAGKYATGETPGDRAIEIEPDGRVRFFKITPRGRRLEFEDSYRIGRQNSKLSLVTQESGVIDIVNIDSLVYYRDAYRRLR